MTAAVKWQTDLPPEDTPFPDGYTFNGAVAQGFDWTRYVRYKAIFGSGLGGIEVTDLETMAVTELVTFDSMYAGTLFGDPPGSPDSQACEFVTCGDDTDVYIVVTQVFARRLARVDPTTWKVVGEFYVNNTITGCVYGAGVECVNVAGGAVIVGSNGNYSQDKAQLFNGTTMTFLWYGLPANYFGSPNKILIPGARNNDGSCDFWIINSDWVLGTSGNIDFWRIAVSASLVVSETLAFTLTRTPGLSVYVQRAEWDSANDRLLVWIGEGANFAISIDAPPTLISVGVTGAIAWTYGGVPALLAREVPGGHGTSLLNGTTMGVVTSLGHVALINTVTGTLIEANTLTEDSSVPPFAGNEVLRVSYYSAWDSSTESFFIYTLGVGSPRIRWTTPEVIRINMDNVVVTSLATESPCTSALFDAAFGATGPSLGLRWSDTRGADFESPVPQTFSDDPEWQPVWRRTGMARDRVFELFWSASVKTALNGAFIVVAPLKS